MSYTATNDVDGSAWTEVATEVETAFVQLRSPGPVLVYVGQSVPASDSDEGVLLNDPGLVEISVLGMEAGDSVWVKSRQLEDNTVVTSAPGTEPGA